MKRAELGTVNRQGPTSKYRWKVFDQADTEFAHSTLNLQRFVDASTRLITRILPEAEIRYNDLSILQAATGCKLSKSLWKALDCGRKRLEVEVTGKLRDRYAALPKLWVPYTQLVRGLHMYRGLVFEVRVPSLKESLGGGGHYELDGEHIGGSIGISRIARHLQEQKRYVVVVYKAGCLEPYKTAIEQIYHITLYRLHPEDFKSAIYEVLRQGAMYFALIGTRQIERSEIRINKKKTLR